MNKKIWDLYAPIEEYKAFLARNGWTVTHSREMQARLGIVYTECVRKQGEANGS